MDVLLRILKEEEAKRDAGEPYDLPPVFEVWHAQTGLFREDATDFVKVARIPMPRVSLETNTALANCFHWTNSIDTPWTENDWIEALVGPCRSTSVGDVIVDPAGVPHRVKNLGFEAQPDLVLGPVSDSPDPLKGWQHS